MDPIVSLIELLLSSYILLLCAPLSHFCFWTINWRLPSFPYPTRTSFIFSAALNSSLPTSVSRPTGPKTFYFSAAFIFSAALTVFIFSVALSFSSCTSVRLTKKMWLSQLESIITYGSSITSSKWAWHLVSIRTSSSPISPFDIISGYSQIQQYLPAFCAPLKKLHPHPRQSLHQSIN